MAFLLAEYLVCCYSVVLDDTLEDDILVVDADTVVCSMVVYIAAAHTSSLVRDTNNLGHQSQYLRPCSIHNKVSI